MTQAELLFHFNPKITFTQRNDQKPRENLPSYEISQFSFLSVAKYYMKNENFKNSLI